MLEVTFSSLLVRETAKSPTISCYCCPLYTIGDALLAFWRCDKKSQQQAVTNVMENGLSIQENYDNFKAGEGINLRMKIAISVGDIFFYHLGMLPFQ